MLHYSDFSIRIFVSSKTVVILLYFSVILKSDSDRKHQREQRHSKNSTKRTITLMRIFKFNSGLEAVLLSWFFPDFLKMSCFWPKILIFSWFFMIHPDRDYTYFIMACYIFIFIYLFSKCIEKYYRISST